MRGLTMIKNYVEELTELHSALKWFLNVDFLKALTELQEMLNKSYLSRYTELTEERGKDCRYTKKAKELFQKLQRPKVVEKINELAELLDSLRDEGG
jgi:hypothetical protein